MAPLPPISDRVSRGSAAGTQQTDRHLSELQSSWQTSQTSHAPPPRQSTLVNCEEEAEAIQGGTSSNEASSPRTSGQLDNLNVVMMTHDEELAHKQEGGATAAQDAQSVEEIVCRPKQRISI